MAVVYDDKAEARKQWSHDPCEFHRAGGADAGSHAFYERLDRQRYQAHPWMLQDLEFDRFRGKKLLEIGFGLGTDLCRFAQAGAAVSGIDLSPAHLELATGRFARCGLAADLQLADAEQMPFADASFDAVYSFGVLHHTPDMERAIGEIHRVLRPGGRAILGVYHRHSAFYWCSIVLSQYVLARRFLRESFRRTISRIEHRSSGDACPLVNVYSRRKLRRLLCGFRSVEITCRHLDPSQFGVLAPLVSPGAAQRLERRLGWYLIAKCTR